MEHWQVMLRRQAAGKEAFAISEVGSRVAPGRYVVRNPSTKNEYKVLYHGPTNVLNYCSCMDFKTSRLMTCKHIEAVKQMVSSKRGMKVHLPDPTLTTLFMDYSSTPRPRIRYGREDRESLKAIFGPLTDLNGYFTRLTELRIPEAVHEARAASPYFRCREDVTEYASRRSDEIFRNDRIGWIFKDGNWWKEIFVKGVTPYAYQREGIQFAARAGRCIIADEMGLGKTVQAIGTAALLYREGYVSSVLIVCPTSLKYQWKREIKAFVGKDALVIEGGHLERRKMYKGEELFKIVSYNSLSNDIKILGGMDVDMVIMDEVQRLKNWSTQIARSARKVRADYSVILSGTPLENKLEELYSIVQLVDQYLLGPYYKFRNDHIETSPSGKVTGYKGLNEIGKLLEPVLIRRRKADVALQLPERVDKNLFVPMTKEQMTIHQDCQEIVAKLVFKWQRMHFLSETDRRRLLTTLSMMRMVCDSTYVLDQETRYDTKVEEAMNIIESIIASGDEKVVVFSGWERMTRLIAQELDARGIGYSNLNGKVPSARRKDLMDRFTDDPKVRVFLSTDAGSTGLNLQAASYIINLDLPWNPAVLEQRIGRIYRIGQRRNIQVINLVSIGTIEERMLAKLKFKSDLFDGVLNGGEDSIFLDDNKLETMVKDFGFIEEEAPEGGEVPVYAEPATESVEGSEIEKRSATGDAPGDFQSDDDTPEVDGQRSGGDSASSPDALVTQGVSFLGNLMRTLKDPEASRALVDAIVKEDPATRQTSINIPVSGKETVMEFVSLLGKLLK